jgi:LCP family protein required for cell wall assembly
MRDHPTDPVAAGPTEGTDPADSPVAPTGAEMAAPAPPEAEADPSDRPVATPDEPPTPHATGPRPAVAAFLSLILPGLGQAAAGRRRRALLVAIPALAVPVVLVAIAAEGSVKAIETLLSPTSITIALAANVVLGLYHAWAVIDADRVARSTRGGTPTRRAQLIVVVLATLTLVGHGALEVVGVQAQDTLSAVFLPGGGDGQWGIPQPSFETPAPTLQPTPGPTPSPGATLAPTPSPMPTSTPGPAWAADGRLNILLIGGDAGPGRWSLRTDTMEVLSVDVATGRAALFGLPRNLIDVPLPPESAKAFPGGRYPGLLNSLYVYANQHPSQFPGGDARGFRAVSGAIQQLIGVPLDGAVVVNLNGFVRLVDAIGGLWVNVTQTIVDSHYPLENGSGDIYLVIKAGCHHFTGHLALAYARSRHMDSDYGRMARQQTVLVDLAQQISPIAMLPRIPDLLSIAKTDLWTTFSVTDAAPIADLLATVDVGAIKSTVFSPPGTPETLTSTAIAKIQAAVRGAFLAPPAPSPTPGGWVPWPTPVQTPTPVPTSANTSTSASRCG